MKKLFILATVLYTSCSTPTIVRTSEPTAYILVRGKKMGVGETSIIKVKRKRAIHVKVELAGYLSDERYLRYHGLKREPYIEYIVLQKDESWDASIQDDRANKYFEVNVNDKYDEDQAWKKVNQIVLSYFDDYEKSDKDAGLIKTPWSSKSFSNKVIRTRIIVKRSSLSPLKYKIKIVSEFAPPGTSVKEDQKFKEWDRVLRTYNEVITEFQGSLQ